MRQAESWTRVISVVTAALVLSLAAFAFILSWNALKVLAHDNGVPAHLTWMFPLVVDGFIVSASLAVVRNSLLSEPTIWQWALVFVFTGISIVFNVLHSGDKLLARVIAAVPPVALVLSFELLMQQLKSEVARHGIVLSLRQVEKRLADRQGELEHVTELAEAAQKRHETALAGMREERRGVKAQLRQMEQERELLAQVDAPRQIRIAARRQQVSSLLTEGRTEDEIAATVGVSLRTIQRDIAVISINGRE